MAEVYEGELLGDLGFKRRVAIKKMALESDGKDDHFNLFFNEANLASKLDHPNIVKITDFFKDIQHQFYIVMEYIDGIDLRTLCETSTLTIGESLLVIQSILKALTHAHEGDASSARPKLIHRDISPHNIMLSKTGVIKLLDFGLAKALQNTLSDHTGVIRGKVSYMSPEQANAEPLDARSDMFSLGVVFYELLTGDRCFKGTSDAATLSQMLTAIIAPPSQFNPKVSKELDSFVLSFLKRDRDERIGSAKIALSGITDFLSNEPESFLNFDELTRRCSKTSPLPRKNEDADLQKPILPTKTLTHSKNTPLNSSPSSDEAKNASKGKHPHLIKWIFGMLLPITAFATLFLIIESRSPSKSGEQQHSTHNAQKLTELSLNRESLPSQVNVPQESMASPTIEQKQQTSTLGLLSFKAKPWANIYVNKKFIGQTPQLNIKIKESPVVVEFVNEEYGKRLKKKVHVIPGKTKLLFQDMAK